MFYASSATSQRYVSPLDRSLRIRSRQDQRCTFRIEWLDAKNTDTKDQRDDIKAIWQRQVPGLPSLTSTGQSPQTDFETTHDTEHSSGHKTLVAPSVFNISCLLPPSVTFLKRFREVTPHTSNIAISTLSAFLNEFLINVFHPQLEESLTECCAHSLSQLDTFQQDPKWQQHAHKPIFKGATRFMEVMMAFCKMLTSLTHDQMFSHLVITQMNAYYDKCCAWFKALVLRAQSKANGRQLKAAAFLATQGLISETIDHLLGHGAPSDDRLIRQEIDQLVVAVDEIGLDDSDLMIDRKLQGSLCLMYTSMKWLAGRIAQLRYISPKAVDQSGMEDEETAPRLKRSLTTALQRDQNHEGGIPTYLPLSEGTSSLFDGIIDGFEQLADSVLKTLHLELRCHIAQSLRASFRGSLLYTDPADAPDESISKLLRELLDIQQELRLHLLDEEYR